MNRNKILIVEDERIIAMDLAKRLEDMDYYICGIESTGKEAIEKISESKPDLILMDIEIKGDLDGIETAERLKHLSIPIIYLTAYSDQQTLERAKLTEPYGYILKPFNEKEISSTIKMALHKRSIENQLKESEKLYRFLYDNYPEVYLTLDKDSNIISINQYGLAELGYKREELAGNPITSIVYDQYWEKITQCINNLLSNNEKDTEITEIKLKTKQSKEIWSRIKMKTAYQNDEQRLILVCEDITRLKEIEQQLINTQKLESLGILAGGIAHNFNNMMSMIMSNVSLARLKLTNDKEQNITEVCELLSSAESNIINTKSLTQQLLTFSKGGKPVKEVCNNIKKLIEESADFVTSGKNVTYSIDSKSKPWELKIDEGQIVQAINNIFINSSQAMGNGGNISIKIENIENIPEDKNEIPNGKYIKISIKDEGIGIESENLFKIFEPYFTTKKNGHGLGLSVTHSIIKNHNGHIKVKSKRDKGTEFTIFLPALGPSSNLVEKKNDTKKVMGSGKILFMDDEKELRIIAEKILTTLGYEVICVSEGNELLKTYQSHIEQNKDFDLVIMDLTIKDGLGGYETIEKLLEKHPNAKAVVSSGYSNSSIMSEYKNYGFVDCITKPYTIKQFSTKINDLINN